MQVIIKYILDMAILAQAVQPIHMSTAPPLASTNQIRQYLAGVLLLAAGQYH